MQTHRRPNRGALVAWLLAVPIAGYAQPDGDLFDDSILHEIRLIIHPSDWLSLRANPQDNKYYQAAFSWRGITLEDIGVRSRGSGSRNGPKPGLRLDFNRFEKQELLGHEQLILKPNVQDASQLHEPLSMVFFRRMGLAAPREAHARLYVNDEYVGLYSIVEGVDKRFLRRNFGEDAGYLYEFRPRDDYRFEYLGPDPTLYSPSLFKPVTHEKDPNPAPLEAMIRTIHLASEAEFAAAMPSFLDLKLYVTHLAADNFIGEVGGISGTNNFYFYRFQGKLLSQFITWDKDGTWEYELETFWKNGKENVLARRALENGDLRRAYLETQLRAAALMGGAGGWLDQEVLRRYNLIREAALEDPNKHCLRPDGGLKSCTNEEFEDAFVRLRSFIAGHGDYIRGAVAAAGYQPAPDAPELYEALTVDETASAIIVYGRNLEGASFYVNGFLVEPSQVTPGQAEIPMSAEAGAGRIPVTAIINGVPSNTVMVRRFDR